MIENKDCSAVELQLKLKKFVEIIIEMKNEELLDNYIIDIQTIQENMMKYFLYHLI